MDDQSEVVVLPVLAAQRELWIAQSLLGSERAFDTAATVTFDGLLDEDVFVRAVRCVYAEADVLKVQIVERDGQFWQLLRSSGDVSCQVIDLCGAEKPEAAVANWIERDLAQGFDTLARCPWVSVLFKVSRSKSIWYKRGHHILLDGYGEWLVSKRVAEVYSVASVLAGAVASVFWRAAGVVFEESVYRSSSQFTRDRDFWLDQLYQAPDAVGLSPREAKQSLHVLRHWISPKAERDAKIRALGDMVGTSLVPVVTALVALYVYCVTGETDLVLGFPVTGRLRKLARSVPASLSNVLPLRVRLNPNGTVADLIKEVDRSIRRILRHQRYRSEDLMRDLGLGRVTTRCPSID